MCAIIAIIIVPVCVDILYVGNVCYNIYMQCGYMCEWMKCVRYNAMGIHCNMV